MSPDDTLPLDEPSPPSPPPRESVKLTEQSSEKPGEVRDSAAEETFASEVWRVKLTEDERDVLAKHLDRILADIKKTREARGWDANWDLWEDAYFGVTPDRSYSQTNVHVPMSQEVVDTITTVVEGALFTPMPWLGVQPREAMDVDVVKRREQFLDYALKVEMHAEERLEPVDWETAVLGTGVLFLPWLRETDRIRDEEVYDGLNLMDMERFLQRYPKADTDYPEIVRKLRAGKKLTLTVEYTEAVHDAPDPTHIPLRDWIVRDTAQWDKLHREPFVGHYIRDLRWDDLVRLEEEGYYDKGMKDRLRLLVDRETSEVKDNPEYAGKSYMISTGILRYRRIGETREARYLVDYESDSRTILRCLRFPLWHNRVNYIPFYYQRSRKYVYGLSVLQKIEGPQAEVDAIHSLLFDATAFSALPMFKALTGMRETFNPLRDGMYPGKVFYMDTLQGVDQFSISGSSTLGILMQLEQVAQRHGELASGATQNLSGITNPRDPQAPATKTLSETQQSYKRIGKYVKTFGSSLVELGFQTCELYYQFAPKGKVYRVMGEEGTPVFPTITRQELRMRVDYYPHGATQTLNPDQERKDNLETTELIFKLFPEVAQDPIKKSAILDLLLSSTGSSWQQKKQKILPSSQELERFRRLKKLADAQMEQKILQAEQQGTTLPPTPRPALGTTPTPMASGSPSSVPVSPPTNGGFHAPG